eukprot:superscaffoldBa00000993_g8409
MSTLMRGHCSGEISHEREAKRESVSCCGGTTRVLQGLLACFGGRTAGPFQSRAHAGLFLTNMWMRGETQCTVSTPN